MTVLPPHIDIHAHTGPLRSDAVVCVDPTEAAVLPEGDGLISVGIHPWNADRATAAVWQRLNAWLTDPRVVAVGEAGIDRLRGPAPEVQTAVFERQIDMAARAGLPLVIHCVRGADVLLRLRKKLLHSLADGQPAPQWIFHGFRGNAALARQLLDAGIDLSFGNRYNAEAFDITPPPRRYRESDT